MKNILSITAALLLLSSCGPADKQAKLQQLKEQQKELNAEIQQLEMEIGNSGDTLTTAKSGIIVQVEPVSAKPFQHFINVQGKITSDKNVQLSTRSSGTVTNVYVSEGDKVSKGQVLAQIDAAIVQKSIEELQTGLDLARTMYEKQKNLWDQNIGTEVQYLQAKNQKESLERKMASLREQLELTRIVAPFSGVVDAVSIKEGELAAPGMPAIRIVNPSDYKVTAEVAENYITQVKPGDKVTVDLPNLKKDVTATLRTVSRVIDPVNRTFTIEADLPDSLDPILKANMIAYLNILDYQNEEAVVIPINAIQFTKDDQAELVFVAENNKAVSREVKVGRTYNNSAEILSGLKPGDKLITAGHKNLVEGQAITVNTPVATSTAKPVSEATTAKTSNATGTNTNKTSRQ